MMRVAVIRQGAGFADVAASECGVPGLIIHPALPPSAGVVLTHRRSGCALAWFPPDTSPEYALAAAREVASLADWTRPGTDVLRHTGSLVRAVLVRWGGVIYRSPPEAEELRGQDIPALDR